MSKIRLLLALIFLSGFVTARGDEEPDSASDKKPKVITITGVFEAINTHEVSADTEQIKSLKIKKIVPHGTVVTKNQNLVWFETEEIDKKIKDERAKLRLAELAFQDEQFAYEQFIETQRLDRAAADRTLQKAKEDFDNFTQVDREREIETAQYNLKNSKASLENVMEELNQLEQMYKEDDLTEQSEEIVLKRAKQAVENAQFRLKGTEITSERSVKQVIPHKQADKKEALTRAQMAHDKSIRDLTVARQKRDVEMGQKRDQFKEEQDNFKELQEERKELVLQAPQAGIVFHGKLTRGKVAEKPSTLDEGSAATNEQVLLTVAEPGKLQIRVDLLEKDLRHVTVGTKGKVKVAAYPDRKITATVKSVSTVPYAGSKFDCVLSAKLPKTEPAIVPGMTCSIEFADQDGDEKDGGKKNADAKNGDEKKDGGEKKDAKEKKE